MGKVFKLETNAEDPHRVIDWWTFLSLFLSHFSFFLLLLLLLLKTELKWPIHWERVSSKLGICFSRVPLLLLCIANSHLCTGFYLSVFSLGTHRQGWNEKKISIVWRRMPQSLRNHIDRVDLMSRTRELLSCKGKGRNDYTLVLRATFSQGGTFEGGELVSTTSNHTGGEEEVVSSLILA